MNAGRHIAIVRIEEEDLAEAELEESPCYAYYNCSASFAEWPHGYVSIDDDSIPPDEKMSKG